jgi:hypothetical protein
MTKALHFLPFASGRGKEADLNIALSIYMRVAMLP